MTILKLTLFGLISLLIACNDHQEAPISTPMSTSNCLSDDLGYDTAALKPRSVRNLDIYNGVKIFRFTKDFSKFSSCGNCSKNEDYKICTFGEPLEFLGEHWAPTLFFYGDSLIMINLKSNACADIRNVFTSLESIFGTANSIPFKINSSTKSSDKYTIYTYTGDNGYSESLSSIIQYFRDKPKSVSLGDYDINKVNEQDYSSQVKKKVNIQYYPNLQLTASWNSISQLDLNVIRYKTLHVWDGTSTNKSIGIMMGYNFDVSWYAEINVFKDTKAKLLYDKLMASHAEVEKVQEEKTKKNTEKEQLKNF